MRELQDVTDCQTLAECVTELPPGTLLAAFKALLLLGCTLYALQQLQLRIARQRRRNSLLAFYAVHNPTKPIAELETLLEAFEGKDAELTARLHAKYAAVPEGWATPHPGSAQYGAGNPPPPPPPPPPLPPPSDQPPPSVAAGATPNHSHRIRQLQENMDLVYGGWDSTPAKTVPLSEGGAGEVVVWAKEGHPNEFRIEVGPIPCSAGTAAALLADVRRRPEWDHVLAHSVLTAPLAGGAELVHAITRAQWPTAARELVLGKEWAQPGGAGGALLVAMWSVDEPLEPEEAVLSRGTVRATTPLQGFMIEALGPATCRLTVVNNVNAGGSVPAFLLKTVNMVELPKSMVRFAALAAQGAPLSVEAFVATVTATAAAGRAAAAIVMGDAGGTNNAQEEASKVTGLRRRVARLEEKVDSLQQQAGGSGDSIADAIEGVLGNTYVRAGLAVLAVVNAASVLRRTRKL